jgi:hypothetical protein
MNKNLFFVCIILTASGLIAPPFALLGGLIYGLALSHPFKSSGPDSLDCLLWLRL